MQKYNLEDMERGWFVGSFEPSVLQTDSVEVAVKEYTPGAKEKSHYHKIGTEITLIQQGSVLMNGIKYKKNDIIVIKPGERTDFVAISPTVSLQ